MKGDVSSSICVNDRRRERIDYVLSTTSSSLRVHRVVLHERHDLGRRTSGNSLSAMLLPGGR